MKFVCAAIFGAVLIVAAGVSAMAQLPYSPPWWPSPPPTSAAPPAWHYNPYTSGLGPCPNRYPTDPPCRQTVDPSYGQPSYWAR